MVLNKNINLYNSLQQNYFPRSFYIGFSEEGISNFQNGFVISNGNILYIKTFGQKIDTIGLIDVDSIRVFSNGVMINNKYKIRTNFTPFNAKIVADVINYITMKNTMYERKRRKQN